MGGKSSAAKTMEDKAGVKDPKESSKNRIKNTQTRSVRFASFLIVVGRLIVGSRLSVPTNLTLYSFYNGSKLFTRFLFLTKALKATVESGLGNVATSILLLGIWQSSWST